MRLLLDAHIFLWYITAIGGFQSKSASQSETPMSCS